MSKGPVYLPISLLDVFELIEDEKVDQIYVEYRNELRIGKSFEFSLEEIKDQNFYIKQEYVSKNDQESDS
ncbi:hypothetical protein [Enterococcus wangshanyuanii]|uniref:Uncharacterized protein n=1 Tax=Enterococcus wangshanyuanii TaxID=2005703 RepID=A0ABQ1NEN4_9ENTE|nr:hypothetical protein [Enterococcus wangshanyuanii]GGC74808.1 hypothetical protein GCM10011573_00420 [Enterococcus wangshanyuanii]